MTFFSEVVWYTSKKTFVKLSDDETEIRNLFFRKFLLKCLKHCLKVF